MRSTTPIHESFRTFFLIRIDSTIGRRTRDSIGAAQVRYRQLFLLIARQKLQTLINDPTADEFSTLVYETAHEMLHKAERRMATTKTVRETEAEAVAFVVVKAVGLVTGTASARLHPPVSRQRFALGRELGRH